MADVRVATPEIAQIPHTVEIASRDVMKAIVQDEYGSADVLELEDIDDAGESRTARCCSASTRRARTSATGTS